jgi:hypothetical protein
MTGSKRQERIGNRAVKVSYIDYNMYETLTKEAASCEIKIVRPVYEDIIKHALEFPSQQVDVSSARIGLDVGSLA